MRSGHMEPSHHSHVISELRKFQNLKSGLADDWLAVVARHVVEPHAVVVEVVEDSQADLVTFSVIWLGSISSKNIKSYKIRYIYINIKLVKVEARVELGQIEVLKITKC